MTTTAPSESLSSRTLGGFKWSTLSLIVQAVLQIAVFSIMTRLLTPREFGVVGVGLLFTNFVERVGFLGIGPVLVQRRTVSPAILGTACTLAATLGLLASMLLFGAAPAIAAFFGESDLLGVVRALSLVLLLESMSTVSENLLQRELLFRTLMVINNASYVIGHGVVGLGTAYFGFGYWSLVFATLSFRIAKTVGLLVAKPQRPVLFFSAGDAKELLRPGIGFSLGRLVSFTALNGDNFVVGRILGSAALGMYGRAYQLMTLPANYFGQILEKVLFPAMARKQDDRKKLAEVYLYGIEASATLGMCGSAFLFFAAEVVVRVLFGVKWLDIVPTLQILSLGMFFRLCYKNSDTMIRSMGAVYRHAALQVVYAFVVVAGAVFGSRWGLEGVSVSVVCAVVVNYVILSHLGMRLLGVSWAEFIRAHLGAAWSALWVACALALLLNVPTIVEWPPLLQLLAAIGISGFAVFTSIVTVPYAIRPKVFQWAATSIPLHRFGQLGRIVQGMLQEPRSPRSASIQKGSRE